MDSSTSLILEIQSGLVNAAIVSSAHVLHFVSVPIVGAPHRDSAHLLDRMNKALSQALKSLPNVHRVSRADCILSSPWIISRTKNLTVKFPKDTLITKKLIGAAIVPEREAMRQGEGLTDLTPIEQKIFEIKINGYPVSDIKDKKGREVGIYFAVSMSPEAIISAIRDTVSRHTSPTVARSMIYHSSILLGYAASRETSGAETNYILGHIHAELSDIALVEKGIATLIASFPFGYSSLVRETSKALGESESAARSKIALHAGKSLHSEETARISQTIDTIMRDMWAEQFFNAITPAVDVSSKVRPLPDTVFLTIPSEFYPHFKKVLENKPAQLVENSEKKQEEKKSDSIIHKAHMFIVNHIDTGLIHTILKL
jgi:hypothetical protein